jgi:uncharacterized protein involved in exopolysaccharide biosynthesis
MQATSPPILTRPSAASSNDNLPLEVLAAIWKSRWRILLFSGICAVAAGAASYLWPKQYEATVLLSPVTNQSNSGGLGALSSAMSQLGGIASLGLSVAGNGGAKAEALATLESEILTQRFIKENNLLPVLFPSQNTSLKIWNRHPKGPTLWVATRYFTKAVRSMKERPKTGLVTLTIEWTDGTVAADWANGLVKLANDFLREKANRESELNIAYLSEQLAKTSVVEMRTSISALIVSEIRKQMLARGSEEYALKVIDPAFAPERAASPQRLLWALAGLCIGLLLSCARIFFRLILVIEPTRHDA